MVNESEDVMKTMRIGMALLAGVMLALAGCDATTTVGTPARSDTPATPLAEVLAAPEKYDGQTVVLKGVLTAQCASRCDFTYTEGNRSITIFTEDPKPPKIQAGQPIHVTAKVHNGESQVILTATGLEIPPRKRTP